MSTCESHVNFSLLGMFREDIEFFRAGFSLGSSVYMEKKCLEFWPSQPRRSRMAWLANTALAHALIASPWPRARQNAYMEKKLGTARRVTSSSRDRVCFSCLVLPRTSFLHINGAKVCHVGRWSLRRLCARLLLKFSVVYVYKPHELK